MVQTAAESQGYALHRGTIKGETVTSPLNS